MVPLVTIYDDGYPPETTYEEYRTAVEADRDAARRELGAGGVRLDRAVELERRAKTIPLPEKVFKVRQLNGAVGNPDVLAARIHEALAVAHVGVDCTAGDVRAVEARIGLVLADLDVVVGQLLERLETARRLAGAFASELAEEERLAAAAEAERLRSEELEREVADRVAEAEAARLRAIEDQVRADLAGSAR